MRHGIETRPASQVSTAGGYSENESRTAPRSIPHALPIDDGAAAGRSAHRTGAATAAVVRSTGVGQSALLLLDAIAVLTRAKVDYAVIGAMAASIYGVVRASTDADAVVSLGQQKQSDLERIFRTAGFQTELRLGDADDPIPGVLQLTDRFENRVDLLPGMSGLEDTAYDA